MTDEEKRAAAQAAGNQADFEADFDSFADGKAPPDPQAAPPAGSEGDEPAAGGSTTPPPAAAAPAAAAGTDAEPGSPAGAADLSTAGDPPPVDAHREKILADLPPEARALFEESEARRQLAERQRDGAKGRTQQLNRQLAELRSRTPDVSALLDSDAMKKATEEYGDVLTPVVDVMRATGEALNGVVNTLSTQGVEAVLDEQEAIVEQKHPDWLQIAAKPEFAQWLGTQPRYVRDAYQRNYNGIVDGEEAADILTRFKSATGIAPLPQPGGGTDAAALEARRRRLMEAGVSVDNHGPGAATGAPDDFDTAFNHYADMPR